MRRAHRPERSDPAARIRLDTARVAIGDYALDGAHNAHIAGATAEIAA
jgi:hypothetical protein